MDFLVYFAVLLVSRFISAALAPKQPGPRPAELEDFQLPRAEQGESVQVIFGSVEIPDPMLCWFGDLGVDEIREDAGGGLVGDVLGGGGDVTVGFRYKMGLHLGLCHGPVDTLLTLRGNTRLAWAGDQTTSGTILIDAPNLYGGDQAEGGIVGVVDVMMGETTQGANAYLTAVQGPVQPGYRGITTLVFRGASGYGSGSGELAESLGGRGGQISVNSRVVKPIAAGVQRILRGWYDSDGNEIEAWYPETARVLLRGPGIITNNAAENQDAFILVLPRVEGIIEQGSAGLNFDIGPTFNAAINAFFDSLQSLKQRLGVDIDIHYAVVVWGETYETVVRANATLVDIEADRATALAAIVGTDYFSNQGALGFVDAYDQLTALGVGLNRAVAYITCGRDVDPGPPTFGDPQADDQARVDESLSIMAPYDASTNTSLTRLRMGVANGIPDDYTSTQIDNQSGGEIQGFAFGDVDTLTDALFGSSVFFAGAYYSMNPAHIIYQCLTDAEWGEGEPLDGIDDASFRRFADTCYAEGMGLCLAWTRQTRIGDFVQHILDHAGAIRYTDPRTGKHAIRAIRADYEAASLDLFDENHIMEVTDFQRGGYGEMVNEVTVVYVDRVVTQRSAAITVQDLANQFIQGSIVSERVQYPGFPTAALAGRAAERDLVAKTTPVAVYTLRLNRVAWGLVPGDPIRISWDKYGLESVVVRVLKADYGVLDDGAIEITCVEDIFGLPDSTYAEQQPSGFVRPDNTPRPIAIQEVIELPYYDLARISSSAELAAVDDEAGYIGTLAALNQPLSSSYQIWSRTTGSADYVQRGTAPLTGAATTSALVTQDQTEIPYTGGIQTNFATVGSRVMLGTGRLAELCELIAIDTSSITVTRAILDTTPQTHEAGTTIFFISNRLGLENVERADGDEVDVSLLTVTSSGVSSLAQALPVQIEMDQRFFRPYPPADIRINGQAYPVTVDVDTDGILIEWVYRNRVTQGLEFVAQDDAEVAKEAGTTVNVYVYAIESEDVLLDSATGLTGNSYLSVIDYEGPLSVRVETVRDGVASWQQQVRDFDYSLDFVSDGFVSDDGTSDDLESDDGISDDEISDDLVSDDIS